jgi:hypothetical protein
MCSSFRTSQRAEDHHFPGLSVTQSQHNHIIPARWKNAVYKVQSTYLKSAVAVTRNMENIRNYGKARCVVEHVIIVNVPEWSSHHLNEQGVHFLIRHGPHRKRRLQFFAVTGMCLSICYLAMIGGYTRQTHPRFIDNDAYNDSSTVECICCSGNVFNGPLPSNDRGNTHIDTD